MTYRSKARGLVSGIGESALSLSFNLGGLLAGTLLVAYLDVFSATPWALLIFPGILSVRGSIGGLFSGRMSTALHVGTVRPSLTQNTRSFHLLLCTVVTVTLGSSIIIGLASSVFGALFLGTTAMDCLNMLVVILTTMGLSIALISPITMGISILSFKKGLDPDVIVYPITSTVADILVTACYILVLKTFFSSLLIRSLIWVFSLFFSSFVFYILIKNYGEAEYAKTVKEFFMTLVLVAFIINITGSTLERISRIIGSKPEIYMVYPALIDTVGDVGSIVGSTATTKLALGMIPSSFSSVKQHLGEIAKAWMASIIIFIFYAAVSSSIHGLMVFNDFFRLTLQLLATNLLACSLIVVFSFAVTIYTHRRGLDPDNFVIPIETSIADAVTTISLLIAITTMT